jgi:hypothetical protein
LQTAGTQTQLRRPVGQGADNISTLCGRRPLKPGFVLRRFAAAASSALQGPDGGLLVRLDAGELKRVFFGNLYQKMRYTIKGCIIREDRCRLGGHLAVIACEMELSANAGEFVHRWRANLNQALTIHRKQLLT